MPLAETKTNCRQGNLRATICSRLICMSKASYYTDLISKLVSKLSELLGTLETLLKGRTEKLYLPCDSSEDLAHKFTDYFECKISTIGVDLDLRRSILQDPFPDACFEHLQCLGLITFTCIVCLLQL